MVLCGEREVGWDDGRSGGRRGRARAEDEVLFCREVWEEGWWRREGSGVEWWGMDGWY